MSSVLVDAGSSSSFSGTVSEGHTTCAYVLRMFVDADRNGELTDDRTEEWLVGNDGRGAMLVTNESGDPAFGCPSKIVVKAKAEVPERTRLGGTFTMTAAHARRVRIARDGKPVIGGETTRYVVDDVAAEGFELLIEAARFRRSLDEEPEILLSFTPTVNGEARAAQVAAFRESPWMLAPRVHAARKVYCADLDKAFVDRLRELLNLEVDVTIGAEEKHGFVQDAMKIGYTTDGKRVQPAVLRTPAAKWDPVFAKGSFDGAPVFAVTPSAEKNNACDGGNIQVSPPTEKYPFGRIYYSPKGGPHTIVPDLQAFLHAQRVQAPFELDASWLTVGHVDELLSFLPVDKGLVACVPSPRLAYALMLAAVEADEKATMLEGRRIGNEIASKFKHVSAVLEDYQKANLGPGADIRTLIKSPAQPGSAAFHCEATIRQVSAALGPVQVIEVPVVFAGTMGGRTEAFTANIVNMVVHGQLCVFPKPYGPKAEKDVEFDKVVVKAKADLFEEYTIAVLKRAGFTGVAIDTWDTYHRLHGEVHCATSVLRTFEPCRWWTFVPPPQQQMTAATEEKSDDEAEQIVEMPPNNDCFFHAVLWHKDRNDYKSMKAVKELRKQVLQQIAKQLFPGVDILKAVEAAMADKTYPEATASLVQTASKNSDEWGRYNDAKGHDDFLGQNVVDAVYRMQFTHEEIEEGRGPVTMKKATIWGDNNFIANAVSDVFTSPIYIYTGGDLTEPTEKINDDVYEGEGDPIRLVLTDNNHWDVYKPSAS